MCYVGTTLFRLVPSDLALDDLEGSKSETLIMHWTAVEPGDRCDKLATFGSVTAIDMWGYTSVWITGVLVSLLICYKVLNLIDRSQISGGYCQGAIDIEADYTGLAVCSRSNAVSNNSH